MKASEVFPSKYLKSEDIGEEQPILTITKFELVTYGGEGGEKKEIKPVLSFKETEKLLQLNKTNNKTLIKLYGDETDDWIGKRIKLSVIDVQFKSEMVPAIRISTKAPTGKAAVGASSKEEDAEWKD